jgi:hypothetical protein
MRDLARRLLAYEALAGVDSRPAISAVLAVYEKLRRSLCALAGVEGFRSLATRALTLARAEAPSLSAVQITADGYLQGLGELDATPNDGQSEEREAILISQLLALLFTFIGEALTLRLVMDIWPEALDKSTSGKGTKV